jgi:hypothetical protein
MAQDRIGIPADWSDSHVVFSQPDTFERLRAVQADPRYWQQLHRTVLLQHAVAATPHTASPVAQVDWSESVSTTALHFANAVTYPAKYSFNAADPTPSCANDYIVYALPAKAATDANLVAFNNLYVNDSGTGTCPGTTPHALFTYNASRHTGKLNSSPVLSEDGTKVAFIEDAASAEFHVLKWKAGDTSPTFGAPWNSSVLPDCATDGATAPCEYSVVYSTNKAALSSPYVDYASDTAYVTDNNGLLAAISPVFGGGKPAVIFSLTVPSQTRMTPPVYDSVSRNVFAADAGGSLYYIRTSAASSGKCASGSPPCVGAPTLTVSDSTGIFDSPIVDSASGTVFVFSKSFSMSPYSAVTQTTTTLSTARVAYIGPQATQAVHAGIFNNAYYNNPGTGMLYVCGTDANNIPQLYGITFTGTRMNEGNPAHGPLALATGSTGCSPLTEVYNQTAGKDYIFLSVKTGCSASNPDGCLEEFNVTNGFPSAPSGTVPENGGTTGIIIDNVTNGSGGNSGVANLYFGTLHTQSCSESTGGTTSEGNCLVKLTQTGLQ